MSIFGHIFTDTIDCYHFYIEGCYEGSCRASGFDGARAIAQERFPDIDIEDIHIYTHFEHCEIQDRYCDSIRD
jgi:hypothetical protein